MDGLASLGVMEKISTGSSSLDMLLCLMLPVLLRYWVSTQQVNDEVLDDKTSGSSSWLSSTGDVMATRRFANAASHMRPGHVPGGRIIMSEPKEYTTTFFSAPPCYSCTSINSLQEVAKKFEIAKLASLHAPPSNLSGGGYDSSDDDDAEQDEAPRLASYTVVSSPPQGAWVKVLEKPDGSFVEFMRNAESQSTGGEDSGGGNRSSKQTIEFHLRSTMDPESVLKEFVADAYKFYIAQISKEKNRVCRYFYQPVSRSKEDDGSSPLKFKRYPLSDSKKFGTGFFHSEKDSLLALIDHFTNQTGKFAIAGFPHKLGLLLHGPPGTGKTSLIKALAQYTGRHIISIPLNSITTNQGLLDIMFDRRYDVVGQYLPVRLPFSKTIFVMEDVDAASDVVSNRSSLSPTASPIGPALHGNDVKFTETKDKLNLAGLLNVLDGVLDSPERIVIMTTNHPEKLDPALIRPGRINKRIYLVYLKPRQALQMAEHYFGKISTSEAHSIWQTVSEHSLTPATLEMMCGEQDTAKELCIALVSEAALETKNKTNKAVMQRQARRRAGSAPFHTIAGQVACAS